MKPLPAGKLPAALLARLLERYPCRDETVIVGPAPGEDAAVVDPRGQLLVAATDPITFATEDIGWYAVTVNANDVACSGARPRWFMATVLLPETAGETQAEAIFADMHAAAEALGVSVVGGHTEVTRGLDRALVIGQMLGTAEPGEITRSGGARPGDVLVLTKAIALEGCALLAREAAARLAGVLDAPALRRMAGLLREPGISVVREALLAREVAGVNAMHDPTEGGLATGLRELADASRAGVAVDAAAVPLVEHCETICDALGIDPLGLIASGALLMAVDPARTTAILDRLHEAGIDAAVIGSVVDRDQGLTLRTADGASRPLPSFARDEIVTALEAP